MSSTLSVVIPCRNAAAFVGETLDHLLTLAHRAQVAVDIVVVDDGSTDDTRAIVEARPVRLLSQGPVGVAAARNAGIADARAPVVGMLDADDRWTPAVFDVLLPAVLSRSTPAIVQGRIRDQWPDVGLGPPYEMCSLSSALFLAEVFDEVGPLDESLPRLEDYEWFVRAYDLQIPKLRVPDPVLHYLRRPDGLTGSAPLRDPTMVRVHRDIVRRRRERDLPHRPGFPSVAEYLGVVPPEPQRRPPAASTLRRLDSRTIIGTSDVSAFACVRNERVRLPAMLEHHRRLGVDTFYVVDNGSTDGSLEYLLAQPDVHLWATSDSYAAARCGTDWLLALMADHGGDGWRLVIDADELFVYPGYERRSIGELCRSLDSEGAEALLAVMVDVYSDRPITETTYRIGDDPLSVCPWFDCQPWTVMKDAFWGHQSHPSFFGGARQRVFGAPAGVEVDTYYTVNKVPLFRGKSTLRPSSGFHWIDGARISVGRAALLHWKYVAGFATDARHEAVRGEHWAGASQYQRYAAALDATPALSMYDPECSVRFVDSEQLGRLGILAAAEVADDGGS
jgi:glycosyltransferase involved in cell wall biosynthesis